MTERPGIGVVGLGHWGPNLMRNFHAMGVLGAFCDSNATMLAKAAATYEDAAAYDGFDALLNDPRVTAVAIATPAVTHAPMVRQALNARKHVFVEKPLCLDVAEAEALKDMAESLDRKLMVGHLLLYHPAFQSLQNLVRQDRLGPLRYIYSNRLSLGKIRREENALWSFAPHDISMILALAGSQPESVTCTASGHLTPGIADTTLTHLKFAGGFDAHIFVSWLHPYKDHRLVVIGENAMVVFNDAASGAEKLQLYHHRVGWDGDIPVVQKAEATPVAYDATEPLRNECEAFLKAIMEDAVPPSNAEEGVSVLKVLDACRTAIGSGSPVALAKLATV